MNIELLHLDDSAVEITITLSPQDYVKPWEDALKAEGKNRSFKGFRVGKAPLGLLKKSMGDYILSNTIVTEADKLLKDYMEQHQMVSSFKHAISENQEKYAFDDANTDYQIKHCIQLNTGFDIPLELKEPITKYNIAYTEEDAQKSVDAFYEKYGKKWTPADTFSEISHELECVVSELDNDGNKLEEGIFEKKIYLNVSDITNTQAKEQLHGINKGDILSLDLKNLFRDNLSLLAQKLGTGEQTLEDTNAIFEVSIVSIYNLEEQERNEAFYTGLLAHENVKNHEELTAFLAEADQSGLRNSAYQFFVEMATFEVLKQATIPLSPIYFEKYILNDSENGPSKKRTEKDLQFQFLNFKRFLLYTEILKQQQVEIQMEDMMPLAIEDIKMQLSRYNNELALNDSLIQNFAQKELEENDTFRNTIFHKATKQKAVDFILPHITFNEVTVSMEEFRTISDAYDEVLLSTFFPSATGVSV